MKTYMFRALVKLLTFIFIIHLIVSCKPESPAPVKNVRKFIKENWKYTIRTNIKDSADLIGMPKPYSVPGTTGMFQEMYYWDTYFTNVGLIIDGNLEQAKNNIEDIVYMVNLFGFMPNGNRTYYTYASQPPYLSMMIRDVYEISKDKEWLKKMLPALEKEYSFWMKERVTSTGLNQYSSGTRTDSILIRNFEAWGARLGKNFDPSIAKTDAEKAIFCAHFYTEGESGWDLSPRFENHGKDFCPVDLNCYLYMYEQNFAFFYQELGMAGKTKWISLSEKRKALINKYLYNSGDGLFYDYDFVNNKLSKILAGSEMTVLWSGMATKEQAEKIQNTALPRLEFPHGIAACEPGKRKYSYQWDYPNGWACIQYLTIKGLLNYGYKRDAKRVAGKYVNMVTTVFNRTNNLWEKYNVADGTLHTTNEYGLPPLMGWTAGVFVYASDYLYK